MTMIMWKAGSKTTETTSWLTAIIKLNYPMFPVVVMRNAIPLTQTDVCVHLVEKCITLLLTATWFFIKMRTTTDCGMQNGESHRQLDHC